MGLKSFHVAFIFLSNLLSLGVGVWCLREASDTGDLGLRVLGFLCLAAFLALVVYGVWFLKKWKNLSYFVWVVTLAGLSFSGPSAMACPVCLGNPKSPLVISANMGVTFLLGVVGVLLVAFGGLFLHWRKREIAYESQQHAA